MDSQPSQSQQSSSKNLKTWFDEFKARVAKKSQSSRPNAGDTTISASSTQEASEASEAIKANASTTRDDSLRLRTRRQSRPRLTGTVADIENESVSINSTNRKRNWSLISRLWSALGWIVYYLIPFNHNLPWKLLSLINFSFVIIVIGLASGSTDSSETFNFTNGFLCGLATASVCSIILTLSFIVYILPRSQENTSSSKTSVPPRSGLDYSILSRPDTTLDCLDLTEGDFCLLEELDLEDPDPNLEATFQISDEDYRGWMIEFIGDYELRNSSDIKLKSIYVKIEKGILYLCKTKSGPDADSNSIPTFTSQRIYDLNHVDKFTTNLLIPRNVRNKTKYVWSKKYPIRIEFQVEESDEATSVGNRGIEHIQLTLLAKSCREKEEWFRKFKRVAELHRLGIAHCTTRGSFKSDVSPAEDGPGESILSSFKRFRCRSPSPKRDGVQSSQSSHFISEPKKPSDEKDKSDEQPIQAPLTPGLARTKSCELLHSEQYQADSSDSLKEAPDGNEKEKLMQEGADDSTLTRETADLFCQNIEHASIVESQPSLNYKEFTERLIDIGKKASPRSDWFNALTGRIFFDVFSHNYWSHWFKRKIQRKLYRIRLPYFMETLTLTQIDLGTNAPQFFDVESHRFDSLGLSIDFAMTYTGGLTMTFGTKLNLLKIKPDGTTSGSNLTVPGAQPGAHQQTQPIQLDEFHSQPETSTSLLASPAHSGGIREACKPSSCSTASTRTSFESATSDSDDSDSDSSSGSSFGEAELNEISDWEDYGAEKTRQNILKFVDKIASSKYFQQATENRYIKKKLQDISNCPLVLVVKIQSLNGVLTLNVPPPQTDRIWYGFKPMPELELKAIPKMGEREVSLSHVTDWIERKLADEFRKILVMPNMEDIPLPVLRSDHMQYIKATK